MLGNEYIYVGYRSRVGEGKARDCRTTSLSFQQGPRNRGLTQQRCHRDCLRVNSHVSDTRGVHQSAQFRHQRVGRNRFQLLQLSVQPGLRTFVGDQCAESRDVDRAPGNANLLGRHPPSQPERLEQQCHRRAFHGVVTSGSGNLVIT